jgi:hypothetical protein
MTRRPEVLDTRAYPILFGKVVYASGTPKGLPRWVWTCGCEFCKRDPTRAVRGPFKTLRAAERDADEMLCKVVDARGSTQH